MDINIPTQFWGLNVFFFSVLQIFLPVDWSPSEVNGGAEALPSETGRLLQMCRRRVFPGAQRPPVIPKQDDKQDPSQRWLSDHTAMWEIGAEVTQRIDGWSHFSES